jgi:hypothetical protein
MGGRTGTSPIEPGGIPEQLNQMQDR